MRQDEKRLVPVRPVVSTGCPETLLRLVREGVGIGQFGEYHVRDDLEAGRLLHLVPEWVIADVPVLAVYPDNRQIAAKVRAFVDFLAKRLPLHMTNARAPNGASAEPGGSFCRDNEEIFSAPS